MLYRLLISCISFGVYTINAENENNSLKETIVTNIEFNKETRIIDNRRLALHIDLSRQDSALPSFDLSSAPSVSSYVAPSKLPSLKPSSNSELPSILRFGYPSDLPHVEPSELPSELPSTSPSSKQPSLSPRPSMSPVTKSGLIIGAKVREISVKHFQNSTSWFYNYKQNPLTWQAKWADTNGIEFVPMIPKPWLNNEDGSHQCIFHSIWNHSLPHGNKFQHLPLCTEEDVVDKLRNTMSARINGTKPRYLLGFNEMYNNPPPKGEDLTPEEAAYYWALYIQPAAIANNLDLVSPTVGGRQKGLSWFSNFLKRCYDKRNDENYPCDIELISKFAVHHYDCRESRWRQWFSGDNSRLVRQLSKRLNDYGGKSDWFDYIRSRNLWVTETTCYHETMDLGLPHPSSKGQCLRITGQKQDTHGIGSLKTMEDLDNIERYAWWTVWNPSIKPNYLTYRDGTLTPIGKAYMSPGDSSVNCEYSGEKLKIDNATFVEPSEVIDCNSTGTIMAR